MTRVLVCGGRNYSDRNLVFAALDALAPSAIAEGGARGADALAREWAELHGVPWQTYPAAWISHGRAAGPIRNRQMLAEFKPDLVLAFPGGVGTAHMKSIAMSAGVRVVTA